MKIKISFDKEVTINDLAQFFRTITKNIYSEKASLINGACIAVDGAESSSF